MKVYILNIVDNIVAKVEIVHDEHFLLWLKCFKKVNAAEASVIVCIRENVRYTCDFY